MESTVIVFARLGDPLSDPSDKSCELPPSAVKLLRGLEARLVLVSALPADYVRHVQRDLRITEAFVCDGGAELHVPPSYRGETDRQDAAADWDVFRFNPPNKAAAVIFLRDLFVGLGSRDILTIGVGCDFDDYGVLAAVDIPVVVRDLMKDQSGLLRYVPKAYLTHATGVDGWAEALAGS